MFHCCVVALCLLVGGALGWTAPHYDLENAPKHFAEFTQKYNRQYENDEEFYMRYEIFKSNLKRINEWNEKYKTDKGGYKVTQFSDQEGHRSCFKPSQMSNETNTMEVMMEFTINAPDHVDYREQNLVTPVKSQGDCGSCYVFAATGNIESMHAKQSGKLISLSEQQGLDCTPGNCIGGDPLNVVNGLVKYGCMREEDYPYEAVQKSCRSDPKKVQVKVVSGSRISTPDVETLKGALVQNGAPVVTSLFAPKSVQHASGFQILNPDECNGQQPNHAVLLVGYSTDAASGKTYWIVKNSWGTDHGDSGYFYFDVKNRCSFGTYGAITSTVA